MISFALTTHNEGAYIGNLLYQLVSMSYMSDDEIVILDDFSFDELTLDILHRYQTKYENIKVYQKHFEGDFADHKNWLNSLCSQDWIFQIDADEILHSGLVLRLKPLLESNSDIDLIHVPRINTVEGLTQEDITNFRWNVNDKGWVMWPDYQGRIYKNRPDIRWKGKVHERIHGAINISFLPAEEDWAIIHNKDVNRQREQNALYDTLV